MQQAWLYTYYRNSYSCVLTCQRRENGESQANRNVASEEAEFVNCFVFVPDGACEFAVAHRVDDDRHKEHSRGYNCGEKGASRM